MASEQSLEKADDIYLNHFYTPGNPHCSCGWIISVFSEGFPMCHKARKEIAEALDDQVKLDASLAELDRETNQGTSCLELKREIAEAILSQLQPKKGEKV